MAAFDNDQKKRANLRKDDRNAEGTLVSYLNEDGSVLAWQGDDTAPFVKICGTAPSGAITVTGLIAHDSPDDEAINLPLKTGSHATAAPRTNVGENDMADTSSDLAGRQRVLPSAGPDGDATVVSAGLSVGGNVAHDAVDAGNPIKIGGVADDQTPAEVGDGDRVDAYLTLEGRQIVNQDLLNAGEDLVNDVLAQVEEPLEVEQHSLDLDTTTTALENSRVTKLVAGRTYEVQAIIDTGINADRFVFILNQIAVPVGGEVPIWRGLVPANATHVEIFFDLRPGGIYSDTGIVVALSTTLLTYTAPANDEAAFHIGFK